MKYSCRDNIVVYHIFYVYLLIYFNIYIYMSLHIVHIYVRYPSIFHIVYKQMIRVFGLHIHGWGVFNIYLYMIWLSHSIYLCIYLRYHSDECAGACYGYGSCFYPCVHRICITHTHTNTHQLTETYIILHFD